MNQKVKRSVKRILVAAFAYNEGSKIRSTIEKVPTDRNFDFMVVDDGSTDAAIDDDLIDSKGVILHRNPSNQGVGAAIRTMIQYGLDQDYDILIMMAGNDKDDCTQIATLIEPIQSGRADFVQGSRYLEGGYHARMPLYRLWATRLHAGLFSFICRKKITDSTNGFRAISTRILRDPHVNIDQSWLDKYELEPYLLFKSIRLGYSYCEVPVSKVYPPKALGYTKMKAVTGWWSIFRPIILLSLGLCK